MRKTAMAESRLERLCAERGMRMTGQRRTIARVLSEAEDHPDVEEVYRRASARDPRISLSTVYRTVRLFEGAGILERHEFGDGRARYEPAGLGHHDHLINVKTGEVIEFSNEQIERLQEAVARELGFRLRGGLEPDARPLLRATLGEDELAVLEAEPERRCLRALRAGREEPDPASAHQVNPELELPVLGGEEEPLATPARACEPYCPSSSATAASASSQRRPSAIWRR